MNKQVEAIRAEIERLKERCTAQIKANPGQTFPFVMEMTGYDKLLALIDSLPEEHPSKDLEKAFDKYMKEEWSHGTQLNDIARYFYELGQAKQMPDEQPSKSLEEAAKQFVGYDMDTDYLRDYEVGIQAFIAGANWQKEQMLVDAVEKTVGQEETILAGHYVYGKMVTLTESDLKGTEYGDKVKIIIVKKEGEK